MASSKDVRSPIETVIVRNINPFDPSTFKPGNFWQEDYQTAVEVSSIHQDVLERIEALVQQIGRDRITRTVLLQGASGSGKSHLLSRMKQRLNTQAFFAYIGPWPDNNYIWRHTLRQTVDSLVEIPANETESQLLLWLNRLLTQQKQKKSNWLSSDRRNFVSTMKTAYPSGLYNSTDFFGVLYALTQPELRGTACDWLRGDDLSEDELKELNIRRSVESEDAAQKILSNFGRIAKDTQPIVLCFDNLDAIPKRNDKSDLQPLMNVNTTIHNERLKNFLVLISVISDTWRSAKKNIQPADLAGIGEQIDLKPISLDQAEAIWASRLHPLHQLAKPKPESAIAPLTRDWLEAQFPGGKTLPRTTLMLGKELLEYFKKYHVLLKLPENASGTQPPNGAGASDEAQFKLIWDKEFEKTKQRVTRLRQFSSPELIQRLRESLEALDVKQVKTSFLSRSTYAANSLSFHNAENIGAENIGVVWTEESNMSTFYHVMNACRNVIKQQLCTELFLIRAENVGKPKSRGNQIYQQLFIQDTHIKPNLDSIYFLETYHSLVNSACSRELVVGQRAVSLKELQAIVRETRVLKDCPVLQELLGDRRTDGENSKKGREANCRNHGQIRHSIRF